MGPIVRLVSAPDGLQDFQEIKNLAEAHVALRDAETELREAARRHNDARDAAVAADTLAAELRAAYRGPTLIIDGEIIATNPANGNVARPGELVVVMRTGT